MRFLCTFIFLFTGVAHAQKCDLHGALGKRARAAAFAQIITVLNGKLAERGVQLESGSLQLRCRSFSFALGGAGPIREVSCSNVVRSTSGTEMYLYASPNLRGVGEYDNEGRLRRCLIQLEETGIQGLQNVQTGVSVAWFYDRNGYSLSVPAQTLFTFEPPAHH